MTSVATNAFAAARERLAAQVIDPPEKRPAYDVFGPPRRAAAGARRAAPTGRSRAAPWRGRRAWSSSRRRSRGSTQDEWTAFVHVDAERALAEARARDAELPPAPGPLHGIPVSA